MGAAMVVAGLVAVADWIAVIRRSKPLEYACKPGVMVALVAAALLLDPVSPAQRNWFVAALVLSMLGDIWLMLPERAIGPVDSFVLGLASFLLAHLAFVAGFVALGIGWRPAVLLVVPALAAAPRILRGAAPHGMAVPVGAYVVVIAAMFAAGLASGVVVAAVGAALFVASDSLIGWSRFVRDFRGAKLAIIVTYHLAQALLVVSLV